MVELGEVFVLVFVGFIFGFVIMFLVSVFRFVVFVNNLFLLVSLGVGFFGLVFLFFIVEIGSYGYVVWVE